MKSQYPDYQVFLNYPFDRDTEAVSHAMHFAVVAAGLIPVCAKDLSTPDRPRLQAIYEEIKRCKYSAHDFSRYKGEGERNHSRFNMPLEMGMALYHAMDPQNTHRCAFLVPTPHDHQSFISDLAGLDPIVYDTPKAIVASIYEWLVKIDASFQSEAIPDVTDKYELFLDQEKKIRGSQSDGRPSHDESQELMFQICEECKWWDWRTHKAGKKSFPPKRISWIR